MASINGLKKIAATDIQNSGRFYLGNQLDTGTAGQVIVSAGPNNPVEWGTNSAVLPNALSAGSHITFSSGNPSFNGSIADTINATPGGGLISGNGIDITGATISTDNDGVTMNNTGGTGTQNQVLKVPNDLTISQNGTIIDTFNGSTAKTIDLEGKYIAGDGIDISGHPVPHIEADTDEVTISHNVGGAEKLQVLKVPNDLTFTGYATGTYNGSSALSINLVDTDTTYTAGNGIQISGSNIIQTKTDNITIRDSGGGPSKNLEVIKVPNALTAGTNVSFSSGTTYDGSAAIIINASDTDTTYQGGTGISIDTTTNPDTINCKNIPNTALLNYTISGVPLGGNLASITFYQADGTFITSYNGANPPTSVILDGDTTYQGGSNISIDTTTTPDTINLDSAPTNLDLSSSTNVFPNFVGGSEILKSMSYIDNTSQNYNRIYNTANEYFFSGSQDLGSDTLEIDFTATSTTGYCEYGFYANTLTAGLVFCVGIAAATGGTSPFSTTLSSAPVSIDAYKIGLFDGTTTTYSLKEILDFDGFENTYITSKFFFNNLSVGTRYRMALYGRCHSSGSIYINSGGKNTTGLASRTFHQPAFMKFYEYDSSIGGARTTGVGGGGK